MIRDIFKQNATGLDTRDTHLIESLLHRGRRQLEILKLKGTESYSEVTINTPNG